MEKHALTALMEIDRPEAMRLLTEGACRVGTSPSRLAKLFGTTRQTVQKILTPEVHKEVLIAVLTRRLDP